MNKIDLSWDKLKEQMSSSQVPTYFESYLDGQSVIVDGFLNIPLFHGTSTLFKNSIMEKGLGGYRDMDIFDNNLGMKLIGKSLMVKDWGEHNKRKPFIKTYFNNWKSQNSNDLSQQLIDKTSCWNGSYSSVYLSTYFREPLLNSSDYDSLFIEYLEVSYNVLLNENVSFLNETLDINHPWHELFSNGDKYKRMLVAIKPKSIAIENLRKEDGSPVILDYILYVKDAFEIDKTWDQQLYLGRHMFQLLDSQSQLKNIEFFEIE